MGKLEKTILSTVLGDKPLRLTLKDLCDEVNSYGNLMAKFDGGRLPVSAEIINVNPPGEDPHEVLVIYDHDLNYKITASVSVSLDGPYFFDVELPLVPSEIHPGRMTLNGSVPPNSTCVDGRFLLQYIANAVAKTSSHYDIEKLRNFLGPQKEFNKSSTSLEPTTTLDNSDLKPRGMD